MYTQFAAVYDHLMAGIDYGAWARYYMALIGQRGAPPKSVCECACGTGLLTVELAKFGTKLTASDLSGEMLELAADRTRKSGLMIPLVAQDMRRLQLHRPVDAIVCACDGVNYLLTDADVRAFFDAAHANLRPGGVLAFDISSAAKLRDMCEQRQFFEDHDELTYLWTNTWRDGAVDMELNCFIRADDGRYDRFDEHQVQRAHDTNILTRLLEESGFANVRTYGDQSFDPPKPGEQRIHIAAIRT